MLRIPSSKQRELQPLSEARLQVMYAKQCKLYSPYLGWLADYLFCAHVGYWQLAREVSCVVKVLTFTLVTSLKTDSVYICIFEIILFLHSFNPLIYRNL